MTSILDCVPKGWKLRPNQKLILEGIEANWNKADVFVVDASVASGKSLVAVTTATFAYKQHKMKGALLVPNNILLGQYKDTFPKELAWVDKQTAYSCNDYLDEPVPLSCKTIKGHRGSFCRGCPYITDLRKMQARPLALLNYHSYIAYKAYRPFVAFDEAHNTIGMISTAAASKLWHHDYHYPSWVKDYKTLHRWVEGELSRHSPQDAKLLKLLAELESTRTTRVYSRGAALYRGEERDVILSAPVDIRGEPPLLWPNKVKKLLMLSATFSSRDIRDLGLDSGRRVCYIDSPSAIPKENRPWILDEELNLSYWNQEAALPRLAAKIEAFLEANPTKGFIHAPYSLARRLESLLGHNERLLFHEPGRSKSRTFELFKHTPGTVMVGSGMYEGVSLDEDLARWQIICKVPWPSLAEPAMKYLATEDKEYYANKAIKDIVQTYGRVCRGPTDSGTTFIWDRTFRKLLEENKTLFPRWFLEAKIG